MAGERLCCAQSCQTDGLPYLRSQPRATGQRQRRAQGFSFILDRNQEPCLAFAYNRTDHGSLNRHLSPEKELSLQQPGQHTPEDGQHYNASHGDTKTNDHHRIGVVVHADISAANAFSPAL